MCIFTVIFLVSVTTAVSALSLSIPQNTTCRSSYSEYRCLDGGCINVTAVCDGAEDCADRSDEAFCDLTSSDLGHLEEGQLRNKRQSTCRKTQFACRDGTCINFDGKCDGIKDCPDGSDETFPLCRKNQCLPHWFRCAYGACVDGTAPCNGIQDCADNSDELMARCKNDTLVVGGRFLCADGSTVPGYVMCDGAKDCADGSDETLRACAMKQCIGNVFQCAYGACVDEGSDCNGIIDCADGSDESDELCNRIGPASPNTPITIGKCVLPPFPTHGSYIVSGAPTAKPGQAFDIIAINVTCHPGYGVLGGKAERLCHFGTWSEEEISCVRFCRLPKDPSVVYQCALTGDASGTRACSDYEPDGTVVVPECNAPNYYYSGVLGYMHCIEGSWDYVARCLPECGLVTPDGTGLIAGPEGKPAKKGELPWHAGIYSKTKTPYKQVCGGSLVSTKVVISAAHCFWWKQKSKQLPASRYMVALGKIYREWDSPMDDEKDVQRSEVAELHLPPRFLGSTTNFQDDVAVVVLTTTIVYYPHVRPVCINFGDLFEKRQLREGHKGKVAGWGLTDANGQPSDTLKTVSLPYVSILECQADSPADFRVYITSDKICAGFRNGSALCEGDSGGGLTFAEPDRGLERYYLRGVVSTAPSDDNLCNIHWLTTFTQLSRHEYFLKPFL